MESAWQGLERTAEERAVGGGETGHVIGMR
jgi:hypothetical protein